MRRVTLLHYVDRRFDLIEAEIDRRIRSHETTADTKVGAVESEIAAIEARLARAETVLERQRGRQAAYAAIATVAGVLLTLAILAAGHVRVG